jgi:tripartite-type tricarboxylate transporter receptor subunit TctC
MTMTGRRALFAALAALPGRASAQDFPARPLAWVLPFPPGNIADAASRVLARRMGQALGQRVEVENRPGAGGTIGTEAVPAPRRTATRCSTAAWVRSRRRHISSPISATIRRGTSLRCMASTPLRA